MAASTPRGQCATDGCPREATWEVEITEAQPPAWHPYCEPCGKTLFAAGYRVRKLQRTPMEKAAAALPDEARETVLRNGSGETVEHFVLVQFDGKWWDAVAHMAGSSDMYRREADFLREALAGLLIYARGNQHVLDKIHTALDHREVMGNVR